MDEKKNCTLAELTKKKINIDEMPCMVDVERREACRGNLRLFCETYFPLLFPLAWSQGHLRIIEKMDEVMRAQLKESIDDIKAGVYNVINDEEKKNDEPR